MRILIDTNIFIPLEDSAVELNEMIATLNRLASGKHELLVHPASYEDIRRDANARRRDMMLNRLRKYEMLERPPELSAEFESRLFGAPRKANDHVDNAILYALHKNCTHWLITEDKGVHAKAARLGEAERVLSVDQAIISLQRLDSSHRIVHPYIDDIPCHELNPANPVFDSLRAGYSDFDGWLAKCSRDGRRAWVCRVGEEIDAICIYKQEYDEIVTVDNIALPGKLLKLCTLKVDKHGYRLGELLLKQAFRYATENQIDHIYLTVEPDIHPRLEQLLGDFGFREFGTDRKGRDAVYEKPCGLPTSTTSEDELEFAIRYYPALLYRQNKVILVPIQPQYHRILFPECQKQGDIFSTFTNSAGNAIKQAYLCHSSIKSIEPGDIVFFYRTHDEKAITSYGVVDQFIVEREADRIFQWVAKRTVYSFNDIQGMSGRDVKIILFRFVGHLAEPLGYHSLLEQGLVNGPIQSITALPSEMAVRLLRAACINDCLISDQARLH